MLTPVRELCHTQNSLLEFLLSVRADIPYLHAAGSLLTNHQFLIELRNSPNFIKQENQLPCSQQPATCPSVLREINPVQAIPSTSLRETLIK
jgi:hypothetical protein